MRVSVVCLLLLTETFAAVADPFQQGRLDEAAVVSTAALKLNPASGSLLNRPAGIDAARAHEAAERQDYKAKLHFLQPRLWSTDEDTRRHGDMTEVEVDLAALIRVEETLRGGAMETRHEAGGGASRMWSIGRLLSLICGLAAACGIYRVRVQNRPLTRVPVVGLRGGLGVSTVEATAGSLARRARTEAGFRLQNFRMLEKNKVWVPREQRPPAHQTLVIFDWDDTLLCTSFLCARQDRRLPQEVGVCLKRIEAYANSLLETSRRYGQPVIVTNAARGWVQQTAEKYMPGLLPTLEQIPVVSARAAQERRFPHEVDWKLQTFLEVGRTLDIDRVANLLTIGDSAFEMIALDGLKAWWDDVGMAALVKKIFMKPRPSPKELENQLQLLDGHFERILLKTCDLKIEMFLE